METVTLKAERRNGSGKKAASALRGAGKVPCIIYGGKKPELLTVDSAQLFKALSGAGGKRVIIDVDLDGQEKRHALLKELQHHPLTDRLLHADFMEISLDKPIRIKLPLETTGEAVGVKIKGGVLRFHNREVKVEGVPAAMPALVKVEISNLDLNQKLTVADVHLPEGVRKLDADDMVLVSVVQPKKEPEKKEEEAVEAKAEAPAEEGKAAGGK